MSGRPFFINIVTSADRHAVIAKVERAISLSGGWLVDHHAFSNRSVSLSIEIASARLATLIDALRDCGLVLPPETIAAIDSLVAGDPAEPASVGPEIRGFVQLTFSHDDPDLRHDVPAVPG